MAKFPFTLSEQERNRAMYELAEGKVLNLTMESGETINAFVITSVGPYSWIWAAEYQRFDVLTLDTPGQKWDQIL